MIDEDLEEIPNEEVLRMTVDIVSAYVSNNNVEADQVAEVIETIHTTLNKLLQPAEEMPAPQKPAVSVRRSVTPDYIVCLEDGRKLKMLKRYLRSRYGLSPDEYRQKWGLAADYPMVAPNYAAQRSRFAKEIGLGRKPGGRK
ncbi:MAG: MucR family transcriptional regulator [Sphingomonadales bacterium]